MTMRETGQGRGTAVVIGGGLAGTLAAWALRGFAERIVVVERDRYPEQPGFRAGLPQGRHAHLLLEAGHRVLEELMPGAREELLAAGAVRVRLAGDLRWLSSAGWMAEFESDLAFLSCTRPVLDRVVLDRVRGESSIEFLEGTEVVGLLGSAQTLTGVQVRERGDGSGEVRDLQAELIVDASGRSSALPSWLAELGCAPVPEERVDAGIAYASRLFHRPPGLDLGYTALYLQTKAPDAPRLGVLLPVEDDRWIVSVGGMRGAEPEPGEAGFNKQLDLLRDPGMREVLASAQPAGEVRGFRPGPGVWRHYERRAPEGLVALGDAACTFNPVYGQGITVAAFGARALRAATTRHGGIGHAAARAARKGVAAVTKDPWVMSSSEDVRFATTTGGPSGALVRVQHRFLDRVLARATTDPRVCAAFQEVMSLVAPPTSLFRPAVLAPVLRGGAG
ncbi:NAD(P)/FAD-dependent oxidoreductase [Kitasatospora atroaurantiaca]|uniref:2-polyprenyl-6-methoxyphenol hydroxylase-like FAD-dependent oxidoreductase n=1 Tax=Kitasatospora atroaurantiaca TaxID=285545 RepID=A0A561F1B1_9ACTN|nr:FAD-dependent monooxygenase [Kitasatospora atroaurantiaca]TWE21644.1 2-polyprenyl-6-methoxyphenol hydroxylase-like FAD-dependent oxidoreductase [Kitasatospora atroaurantiaca]